MEGGLVPHTDIEQQRHHEEHPAQRATFKECMQSTLMARLLVHLSPLHVKELHSLSLMAVHTRFLSVGCQHEDLDPPFVLFGIWTHMHSRLP